MPFMGSLYMASPARALLENLQPARAIGNSQNLAQGKDRGLPRQQCPDSRRQAPEPHLRDQAKKLSRSLGLSAEYKVLDALIGAMLGTRDEKKLSSAAAKARAKGVPYDSHRLELFTTLYGALRRQCCPCGRPRS